MGSKQLSRGALGALTDKAIAFWQSDQFYQLTKEAGRIVEKKIGPKKPDGMFVKGGRRRAEEEAQVLWGKLARAKPTPEAEAELNADDRPLSDSLGERFDDDGRPSISGKGVGSFSGLSFPRGGLGR
jgi:hypothetical protein